MLPQYRFRLLVTAGCLAALLSGCGGGSSTRMDADTTESIGFTAGVSFVRNAVRTRIGGS